MEGRFRCLGDCTLSRRRLDFLAGQPSQSFRRRVAAARRWRITDALNRLSATFTSIAMRFGYMESPNVPMGLAACRASGVKFDVMSTSFFLSRRALRPAKKSTMPHWQDKLFIGLARSSDDASRYF